MLKTTFKNCSALISGLLPYNVVDPDYIAKDSKTAQSFYKNANETETGIERLYLMFSMDEFGNISPELNSVRQAGYLGLFVGAVYGGFLRSRTAYMDFIERNQATAFKSQFEAKKKLQDAVTLSFGKGAFQWGWRLALFTSSYVLITSSISVYRGKSSIIEYIAAGGVTGALYKSNLGFRGIIAGGILGSVLGTIGGCCSLILLKMSGMSMEEVRYWQYKWKLNRDAKENAALESLIEDYPLIKQHEEIIGTTELKQTLDHLK